MERYQ